MPREILVVETDAARRQRLATTLEQAGFVVVHADGFEEALTRVRAVPIALVITAVRLGVYNGLHLILRARSEHPHMGAIITSPSPDPVVQANAAAFGAEYFVAPWSDHAAFLEVVSRLANADPV